MDSSSLLFSLLYSVPVSFSAAMASELEYADTEELISASSESENQSENPFSQAFANARERKDSTYLLFVVESQAG